MAVDVQHDLPHRRVEPRDDRLALTDLEPAAAKPGLGRAHDEVGRRGVADKPPRPPRAADGELDGQPLADRERVSRPQLPVPDGNGNPAPVGPADDDARDVARVAGLDDPGERLCVRRDARLRPPEQRGSGRERAGGENEGDDPEGHPNG